VLQRVELGALTLEDWVVPLVEAELPGSVPDSGILGQDVLARLVIVLDGERSQLHVLPSPIDREGIQRYLAHAQLGFGDWAVTETPFTPAPLLSLALGAPVAADYDLEIDTGATNTTLPKAAIDALHLEPIGKFEANTISGPSVGSRYMLRDVRMFGLRISGDVNECKLAYGLLGMDILNHLVLVIDAPGKSVWLHKRNDEHTER